MSVLNRIPEPYEPPLAVRLGDRDMAAGACSSGSAPAGSCKSGGAALAACNGGSDAMGSCFFGNLPHHCSNGGGVIAIGR
jgi:hypothetical protein